MRSVILIATLLLLASEASAKECTTCEAYAAECVTDYLSSWKEVHHAFQQFSHCIDGSIAEGFDDKISVLWADHWELIPEMIKEVSDDTQFREFVYRHVGSQMIPSERWAKIMSSAKTQCPAQASEFCNLVLQTH